MTHASVLQAHQKNRIVAAVTRGVRRALVPALAMTGLATAAAQQPGSRATTPDRGGAEWSAVQQVLGGMGAMQPGGVLKFGFPRSDLHVTVDALLLSPAFALGSWIAFKRMGGSANAPTMVMGDLVLTEDELGPVMLALQQRGIEQTAVHNHLLHESPRVMYVHIRAHGDAVKIASDIRAALGESMTPLPATGAAPVSPGGIAATSPAPVVIDVDTVAIARALGAAGRVNGGVYQFSIPRAERVIDDGMEVPPSMGVATAINFQPAGGGKAAITGDFVMTASEVNPVIRALRDHNIQVTALHSHMLRERPRLFFMHFWANDDAVLLAGGLRAALDRMKVQRPKA